MSYCVLITDRARHDIENAADYIEFSLKNPIAADNLLSEFKKAALSLAEMPERYSLVDDVVLASWGIRCFNVKNYILFYRIDKEEKAVTVLRFLYGRSSWRSILRTHNSKNT